MYRWLYICASYIVEEEWDDYVEYKYVDDRNSIRDNGTLYILHSPRKIEPKWGDFESTVHTEYSYSTIQFSRLCALKKLFDVIDKTPTTNTAYLTLPMWSSDVDENLLFCLLMMVVNKCDISSKQFNIALGAYDGIFYNDLKKLTRLIEHQETNTSTVYKYLKTRNMDRFIYSVQNDI